MCCVCTVGCMCCVCTVGCMCTCCVFCMCGVFALLANTLHLLHLILPILSVAGGAAISITIALVLVCFCAVHTPKCAKERKMEWTLRKDLTLKVRQDLSCDVPWHALHVVTNQASLYTPT